MSGMISWRNDIYLGTWYRLGEGVPDHIGGRKMYGFRFLDEHGQQLSEVGLPVAWNHAEYRKALPVTFFGLRWSSLAARRRWSVEPRDRERGTLIATTRGRSERAGGTPRRPEATDHASLALRWTARDDEGSELTYAVMISQNGERWRPATYGLTESRFDLYTAPFASGEYMIKVLALNWIRVGESNQMIFQV